MKRLSEIFGMKEGVFDRERASGQKGGPTTEPSVRKHQDRAARWTRDTGRAQSELDSAQSVAKREALGDQHTGISVNLTPEEINWIVNLAQRSQGTAWPFGEKAPRDLADKLNNAEHGSTSQSSTSMTRSTGGLKLQ